MFDRVYPITPNRDTAVNVPLFLNNQIPKVVIEVFNELIDKDFDKSKLYGDRRAFVPKSRVIKRLKEKSFKQEELTENLWLDIADYYRDFKWRVVIDGFGDFYFIEKYPE